MSRFRPRLPVLAISLALLFACDSQEEDQRPEIVLGKSIAGVEIGMDSTDVKARLGEPDEIIRGDFPGVIYLYSSGQFAGLDVEYSGLPDFGSGVASICATPPFSGQTFTGLRIGSTRGAFFSELGDSLYTQRFETDWMWELFGSTTARAIDYYNLQTGTQSIQVENSIPNWDDLDSLPVTRLCLTDILDRRDWQKGDADKFFSREPALVLLYEELDWWFTLSLSGFWRLDGPFTKDNYFPQGLRIDSLRVEISGFQKNVPLNAETLREIAVNTISRLP